MANYNILMNRFNGTTHDTMLPKNSIEGTSDPTTSTKGIVGQFYLNATTKRLWQCTNVNGSVYTWGLLYPNKNLFVNAWFEEPYLVNQRGQSSYGVSGNYSIDRFIMSGAGSVAVGSNGLTITRSGDYVVLMQRIELVQWNKLVGKKVTASLMIDGSVYGASFTVTASGYNDDSPVSGWNIGIETLTAAGYGYVQFVYVGTGAVTVQAVKLELGSVSTLHLDTPPSPAEQELNRQVCMRYYQRIDSSAIFTGTNRTATQCVFTIPYLVKMRTAPTVSTSSTAITYFANSTGIRTLTSLTTEGDGTVLVVTIDNSIGSPVPVVIKFNSPIILSADL